MSVTNVTCKIGEKEIKFWHEKDSGFDGRKPISVDAESLI